MFLIFCAARDTKESSQQHSLLVKYLLFLPFHEIRRENEIFVLQSTVELYRQAQKMSMHMGLPELGRSFWDSSVFKGQCPSEIVAACSDEGVRWVLQPNEV